MKTELDAHIERARELLKTTRHAAMATVNEDGSPHNTPFRYIVDDTCEHIYWASSPESVHSQNLARTGRAFIVVYEPGKGGGLYLQAENVHVTETDELQTGMKIWNAKRAKEHKPPLDSVLFTGDSPQRMYRVDLVKYWVNYSEKDNAGNILKDHRHEITREDLLV
ncbi:MAG: pyridoxamine 5'-phosphate oxidase family protein [Candidatus Saccharimonadales bacterium]